MNNKFITGVIVVVASLLGLLILGSSVAYKVDPGFKGLVYSMSGGLEEKVRHQGWHFLPPWKKIIEYPTSTEMNSVSIEGGTNDGKTVQLKVEYSYKMDENMLPQVFTKFRGRSANDIADSYINQLIRDHTQAQTRKNSVLSVYSQNTTKIIDTIFNSLQEELGKDGIILEKFTINDVIADNQTLTTLQAIADAQNRQELLKREEANKEQEARNNLIEAEGRKAVAVVNAKAEAERQLIEAEARAEANRKLTESLSGSIIQYEWIKQWDGILPTHILGDDSGVILGK